MQAISRAMSHISKWMTLHINPNNVAAEAAGEPVLVLSTKKPGNHMESKWAKYLLFLAITAIAMSGYAAYRELPLLLALVVLPAFLSILKTKNSDGGFDAGQTEEEKHSFGKAKDCNQSRS